MSYYCLTITLASFYVNAARYLFNGALYHATPFLTDSRKPLPLSDQNPPNMTKGFVSGSQLVYNFLVLLLILFFKNFDTGVQKNIFCSLSNFA